MATTIGLFQSYTPPGVYTRSLLDRASVNLLGGIRIPVLVGPGDEVKTSTDEELFRGSSATADNPVFNEDVSSQLNGTNKTFTVSRFPIVDGLGTGTTSDDPASVQVTVNGDPVVVIQVDGANGEVTLQKIPRDEDVVKVTYFFKRTDTLVTDEDISDQFGITPVASNVLQTKYYPIVDGSNGGVPTNDPLDVTVTVNGSAVTVESLDGVNGLVTLAVTPSPGDAVLITYYWNMFPNTSDSLRYSGVTRVVRVGAAPGRRDFTEGVDYVLFEDEIHWGAVSKITTGTTSVGTIPISSTQVITTLRDDRVYFRPMTGTVNANNRTFTLEFVPTDGSGIGRTTSDPQYILVYVGTDLATAKTSGPVSVARLTGATKTVVLEDAPPTGSFVFATQYRNRLPDDVFTLTCTVRGGAGVGKYTLQSQENASYLATTVEGTHSVADPDFGTEGITWPNAQADFLTSPSAAVDETVTLTFTTARDFTVTSTDVVNGSSGTGEIDQTYIDAQTGLAFTVQEGTDVTYAAVDTLQFVVNVGGQFTAGTATQRAVPGVSLAVLELTGVDPGNTATVSTFHPAGLEPDVGDFYYVTYEYEKSDYATKVFTTMPDVQAEHGTLRVDNKVVLGAFLAFQNGAIAVGIKQVQKQAGLDDGSSADYSAAFTELEVPFGAGFKADIITPLNTDETVLSYLRKHCDVQSTERYQNERTAIVGVASGTTPAEVQTLAKGFKSRRFVVVYPDTAVITLSDPSGLGETEQIIDGSFLAAAHAGLRASPTFDVAEPMTRKHLVGFTRLGRRLTQPEMNQTAIAGITMLREIGTDLQIVHSLTTDMTSVLTREYNVTTANDFIQVLARQVLDGFIGTKNISGSEAEVEAALGAMLISLVNAQIVSEYASIFVEGDAADPTVLHASFAYKPIFAINWIEVVLYVRTALN